MRVLLLAALLFLIPSDAFGANGTYRGSGLLQNVAVDTDNDGFFDYIECSDFNGNNILETEDIELCIRQIDSTSGSTVFVLSGTYTIPAPPFTALNASAGDVERGVLQPTQGMVIECQNGATITGIDEPHIDSDDQMAVVYLANDDSGIRNCEIDGGFPTDLDTDDECGPSANAACAFGTRMGIFVNGAARSVIENNYIHHTAHACIYVRNAVGINVRGNQTDWCGSSWDADGVDNVAGTWVTQPSLYIYADDSSDTCPTASGRTAGVVLVDNNFRRSGGAGINFRKDEQCDIVENITMRGNVVTDNVDQAGKVWGCVFFRGAWNVAGDITCSKTAGIQFPQAVGYWNDVTNGVNANRNISLHVSMENTYDTTGAIIVGSYQDTISISGSIRGNGNTTEDASLTRGVLFTTGAPSRQVTLHDLKIINTETSGIEIGSYFGASCEDRFTTGTPETTGASNGDCDDDGTTAVSHDLGTQLTFSNLQIHNIDYGTPTGGAAYSAILASRNMRGFTAQNIDIVGYTENGMDFQKSVEDSHISAVRGAAFPTGFIDGIATVATLPTCCVDDFGIPIGSGPQTSGSPDAFCDTDGTTAALPGGGQGIVQVANNVDGTCLTGGGASTFACYCQEQGVYGNIQLGSDRNFIRFDDTGGLNDRNVLKGIQCVQNTGDYCVEMQASDDDNLVSNISVSNPFAVTSNAYISDGAVEWNGSRLDNFMGSFKCEESIATTCVTGGAQDLGDPEAGCFIIRDSDDAGDTACEVLNGTMTCETDTNGVCGDAT